jgi:hypothetical protein
VFAGFALAGLLPVKQLGVGLALAVILDATVVRGVLVPAAMAVMGRGNWWWPRCSRRQHRTAVPQKIATMVPEASVSVPDEKQAVGKVDGHAAAALMADVGAAERRPGQRYVSQEPPTIPQEILTTAREGSAGVRDQKQAVDAFDDHAGAARMADAAAAGRRQRSEFGAGRIHYAADVQRTVVLELPWRQPTG